MPKLASNRVQSREHSDDQARGPVGQVFRLLQSLLIAVVVVYGFSYTVDQNLIHAAVFSGWVLFFILQSTLIRTHNVRLHRRIGWFGVALGVVIPVLGISTAVTMARFKILHFNSTDAESFLIVSFFDMIAFALPFARAIYWRTKPEFRLLLIASCALTAAAFGRFPTHLLPPDLFYAGVDVLVLFGVVRDLVVNRRIHPAYLYGLPALILGQTVVLYTLIHGLPYWHKMAHVIVS